MGNPNLQGPLSALCGLLLAVGAGAAEPVAEGTATGRLAEVAASFRATQPPVILEYDLGYRFLNIELADIGRVVVTTSVGEWAHRVSGRIVPALLLDVRVDSRDSGRIGERRRVSIHDRILSVLTVPDLQALLFARYTDQHLNPLIGRLKEVRQLSLYDAQSGHIEYAQHNLRTGSVATNLVNAESMMELTHQIGPLMAHLVEQCRVTNGTVAATTPELGVNMDGRVVSILLKTKAVRSPACLGRQRMPSLCVSTAPAPGSAVKPRDFNAWSMSLTQLARSREDPALHEAARIAPVESIVPLVLDYELALGSVRATMTGIRAETEPRPAAISSVTTPAAPRPVL